MLVAEKKLILPGDAQLDALSDADKLALLNKPADQRRRPHADFIKDRLMRRARREMCQGKLESYADYWGEYLPVLGAASYVTVTLDTTAPAGVTVSINGGAAYATSRDVTLTIATSDTPTTGYTMKIYGDVDDAFDTANYRTLEANAPWITYATSKSVRLTTGDGAKTVRIKVRDDVWNVSSEATDAVTLDTTLPTVTVQAGSPDVTKISKISGKDTVTIVWQSDQIYDEYKVKVVPATGSTEAAGTTVPTTAGSTNTSGSTANAPAATNVTTTIKGTDLETASAGDGAKIIKIFVKDDAGNWSV
jgi:mRNA-degrading endonuclease toxin of MazEF toxin-antitoxin module